MRARRAIAAALVVAGCSRPAAPPRHHQGDPTRPGQRICRPIYSPPAGFLPAGTMQTSEGSYRGVRQSYRDGGGRALVLTAGVRGEFGEGAPAAGELQLSTHQRADLLGGGTTWILIWEGVRPCTPQTITGNEFTRAEFLALLQAMGAVAAPEP